ncbi:hypothetical protein TTRE_0000935901 [Trichuris trichiura]|uniref:Uncharacterized protein n=1 Tax=Trichuris trichiura TaxID=36087 RepID=A0A077ZKS0_TRITR|nr:hypothetical protein TTRE_0000935901 [Trichuris trichiura]
MKTHFHFYNSSRKFFLHCCCCSFEKLDEIPCCFGYSSYERAKVMKTCASIRNSNVLKDEKRIVTLHGSRNSTNQ